MPACRGSCLQCCSWPAQPRRAELPPTIRAHTSSAPSSHTNAAAFIRQPRPQRAHHHQYNCASFCPCSLQRSALCVRCESHWARRQSRSNLWSDAPRQGSTELRCSIKARLSGCCSSGPNEGSIPCLDWQWIGNSFNTITHAVVWLSHVRLCPIDGMSSLVCKPRLNHRGSSDVGQRIELLRHAGREEGARAALLRNHQHELQHVKPRLWGGTTADRLVGAVRRCYFFRLGRQRRRQR